MFTKAGGKAGFYPYRIPYSCRFNDDDTAYLTKAQDATPTDEDKWTYSVWVKRCYLDPTNEQPLLVAETDADNRGHIRFAEAAGIDHRLQVYSIHASASHGLWHSDMVFADTASWYHIVVAFDAAQAVAADRLTVYVNGSEITGTTTTAFTQNQDMEINTGSVNAYIGYQATGGRYFDGYMAESIFVDGQALTPSSFGTTKHGIWVPKPYVGTYGDNGWYLDFANSGALGTDASGTGNWTPTNLAANDQVPDSPTNNYCTLNPLATNIGPVTISSPASWANGSLEATGVSGSGRYTIGTIPIPASGKWYWEVQIGVGVDADNANWVGLYTDKGDALAYGGDGQSYDNNAWAAFGDAWDVNDVMGVAYNADTQTITFYNQGVSQGSVVAANAIEGLIFPTSRIEDDATAQIHYYNFGQLGFTYAPPAGFKTLCNDNLPTPMSYENIHKGFDTVLYEGTGAEKAITDLTFSPDLVWIKNRDAADEHVLTDSVRGVTKELNSDSTNAESTVAQGVKSFDANGFTLGTQAEYNTNSESYVAWNWQEDPTYEFDIVTYAGTGVAHTESHSLGVVPEMIIVKNRDAADATDEWFVYHKYNTAAPETDYLVLNDADITADDDTIWNDTAPTSSVFSLGTGHSNVSGENYIAYLFASVEGFSKVFSYTGNGSADGPFVYTGFRPAYVLIKKTTTATNNWQINDSQRDPFNNGASLQHELYADTAAIEAQGATTTVHLFSNGFKIAGTANVTNTSGESYVGIAFADTPFKWANAR